MRNQRGFSLEFKRQVVEELLSGKRPPAYICPSGARKLIDNYLSADWLLGEIMKDYVFYQKSGGGVTIGGGEPLSQPDFVRQVLRQCRQQGIATAIETCGHVRWEQLGNVLEYVDLVLFNIKHIDPDRHGEPTQVSNELILENARLSPQATSK